MSVYGDIMRSYLPSSKSPNHGKLMVRYSGYCNRRGWASRRGCHLENMLRKHSTTQIDNKPTSSLSAILGCLSWLYTSPAWNPRCAYPRTSPTHDQQTSSAMFMITRRSIICLLKLPRTFLTPTPTRTNPWSTKRPRPRSWSSNEASSAHWN